MARKWKIAIGILAVAVVVGLISFRDLNQRLRVLSRERRSEEQARREVLAPPITTPTDVTTAARIFFAGSSGNLAPVEIQLPLSADPAQRAKQVLQALIASPPSDQQRTLPADAEVLAFYVLPDGSAVADFSDALASETPSGILSEQLVIDSIIQTLENNVPSLRRLKILIHGQEVDTLAGHIDLTGFFDLNSPSAASPPALDGSSAVPAPTTLAGPGATPAAAAPSANAAAPVHPSSSGQQSGRSPSATSANR